MSEMMDEKSYYVSCSWATCLVITDEDDTIVMVGNIWKKFLGQPLNNLVNWLVRNGSPVKVVCLDDDIDTDM